MLIDLFQDVIASKMTINQAVTIGLILVVTVFFSLAVHECCHGLAAYALGDPTAKNRGRLTINPIKHLNPLGAICMLLVGFGWANPVPVNPNYFKNRKAGMAITALAGPLSNFVLALLATLFYVLIERFAPVTASGFTKNLINVIYNFFIYMQLLNINLAIFNLIPVPPLDGSRILNIFLPEHLYFKVMRYEQYIAIALVVLIWLGVLTGPLSIVRNSISVGLESFARVFIR